MMAGNPTIIDPRDDVLGRARVTDTPELEAFYQELAARNAGAFWKRANAIEPWEPETRYRQALWRYAEMRDMCLRALEVVKPEEAGRRVVTMLNERDAWPDNDAWSGWTVRGMKEMSAGERGGEKARGG